MMIEAAAAIVAIFAVGSFVLLCMAMNRIDDLRVDVKAILLAQARMGRPLDDREG